MNRNVRRIATFGLSGLPLLLGACATVQPPRELVDARAAYQKASEGPPSKLDPSGLFEARKTLDAANKSFESDPSSSYTRDMSYIALRKIQLSVAHANIELANQEKAKAEQDKHKTVELALAQTQTKLTKSQAQLDRSNDALSSSNQQLDAEKSSRQIAERVAEEEKTSRQNAEKRAEEATANLNRIASVKQEQRGLVITLSGSVLFTSGRSTLLSNARPKLDEVAQALQKSDGNTFVVEGHTDAQGSESFNQDLSVRRAETVREYLVERGVASDTIRAIGFGKSRPVAENDTAEGRANNRRVEIIIARN